MQSGGESTNTVSVIGNVTIKPVLWAVLLLGLILAASGLLVPSLSVVLLVFAGILFGILMNGVSSWCAERTPLSYRTWYLILTTVLILLILLGVFYLGSQIVQRADELWVQLQSAISNASEQLRESEQAQKYLPDASQVKKAVTESQSAILPEMLKGFRGLGWAITSAFVIFFVGLYAAYEPDLYRTGLIKLVPKHRRGRAEKVFRELRSALGQWIIGRMSSMAIIGVLTAIGLWLLGLPLPITLGVVAALLTFIPNIGPLLAAVPQVLLALNLGSSTVIYVLIFNVALQGVESYLITPVIQRHEASLPPILTIAAQLLMGVTVGVIGIMMAAPLVVVIMVLTQMLYIHDQLGDSHPGELTES
ncbi:AI-2E family transporter [Roseiconus nitratireducens]|uniref:AI-2E family transporter n=2 Tax=Roseiconus nitratireducens TaxID=2605748 RepID=A0A5M6D6S1_9BACT|nr:AI-2E family transporter [Roseiconus nitratireducens]